MTYSSSKYAFSYGNNAGWADIFPLDNGELEQLKKDLTGDGIFTVTDLWPAGKKCITYGATKEVEGKKVAIERVLTL